jgi:phospholipid/cholesterol/gamma-HCH transport system ATP-binding protein
VSEAVVTVRDLAVSYGELKVLSGVSAEMRRGEITVILGGSGCGKTTLLKAIAGLLRPDSGEVTVLGEDTARLDEDGWQRLRRRTGMLFQAGALLNSMSVLENVSIPLQQHTALPADLVAWVARSKIALVGLDGADDRLPSELSGGMRKRAALARALALDPELLFFDEPSAGLDPVTSASLDRLILSLRARLGMSLIIVTHEPASIRRLADHILFLDEGRVVYDGTLAGRTRAPAAVQRFFAAAAEGPAAGTPAAGDAAAAT